MFLDVEMKIKRKNKILFSRDSSCLQELIRLIQLQNHRTLIMWIFECAQITLNDFETKYPNELRPRICLELSKAWANGKIKMSEAKKAILASHQVAKEIKDPEFAALCHAIGHAGATVHVETHALGLVFYELTAIVLRHDKANYQVSVEEKINYYLNKLLYWQDHPAQLGTEWAPFLFDESKPNKEKQLAEK